MGVYMVCMHVKTGVIDFLRGCAKNKNSVMCEDTFFR